MCYTYIVRCADGTLYTGWTTDLARRLAAHNSGKGAKYTRARTPVTLVYYECRKSRREAMSREAEIKRLSRGEKQKLCRNMSDNKRRYMKQTTLCHIGRGGCWLMLHRTKKQEDLNEGKWVGIGGHVETGETPEQCVRREVTEETGLVLKSVQFRGVVDFLSDRWGNEAMYLYTSDDFEGEVRECDEGDLAWIPVRDVFGLPLWEGDRIFLNYLLEDEPFFHLELHYDKEDRLISSRLIPPLILASASPRRLELLGQIGLNPVVLPVMADESVDTEKPEQIVKALAARKAGACAEQFRNGEWILGADTIVVNPDGQILGKPGSVEEAVRMITSLQGRTHRVYTGVCVIRAGEEKPDREETVFAEMTEVDVAPMTEEEILLYAAGGEPMDKAGAYGIQGQFAAFIRGIRGDYCNVVGLPVHRVYEALKEAGI